MQLLDQYVLELMHKVKRINAIILKCCFSSNSSFAESLYNTDKIGTYAWPPKTQLIR